MKWIVLAAGLLLAGCSLQPRVIAKSTTGVTIAMDALLSNPQQVEDIAVAHCEKGGLLARQASVMASDGALIYRYECTER